jgi:hypothetical protein
MQNKRSERLEKRKELTMLIIWVAVAIVTFIVATNK